MITTQTPKSKPRGRVRVETGTKRVRAYLGGEAVADTMRLLLVWEAPSYPTYYFPVEDVRTDLLEADGDVVHSPSRGEGRLDWHAMDAWFEEDEEVFTHPRDPYTRVDILPSSRHVRVEVDGITVAESTSPRLLFETGLPVRYYLPKTHVRLDLLDPTDSVSHCPYKGDAEWWSVRIGDDVHSDLA
jgi:uncharacterized protein (DUF427 family)